MTSRIATACVAILMTAVLFLPGCAAGPADEGTGGGGTQSTEPTAGGRGDTPAGTEEGSTSENAKKLVLERCTKCHDTERIKQAEYDKAGWLETIGRMRQNGAQVNDTEADEIADYLSRGGNEQL